MHSILKIRGKPVLPSGLADLKQNLSEYPCVGSILLNLYWFSKQIQRAVELSSRTGSWSRLESTGLNNTVRSYLYPVKGYRLMIPYSGEGMSIGEGKEIGDKYW